MNLYPAQQLSSAGNRVEFSIPATPLGDLVCRFHLVWAKVNGEMQPCINHPSVYYPGFTPVRGKEVYNEA